jgi:WD40 repeat protein
MRHVGHNLVVVALTYSNRGDKIASASMDNTIILWCSATADILRILAHHTDRVSCIRFSPDDTEIASCSDDETVTFCDSDSGIVRRSIEAHTFILCYTRIPNVGIW